MNRLIALILVLGWTPWASAQQARTVPPEILERIVDDDPHPLPRSLAPREHHLPLPRPPLRVQPPSGVVHASAEYEPNDGLLIRWGSYNALLTEIVVAVTTADPQAVVHIVVTGPSQEASASATLDSAGAEMDQVDFIHYVSDSVWIRDYGPRFIFEDEARAMVDHTYNRPRPLDNLFPDHLSALWGEPQYDLPLTHGGGNFHLFADGDAFMSDLILSENPGVSEQDVKDYYRDYLNVDLTIYEGFPFNVDGTKHIDMWMLPVDDRKVIIGQYSGSDSYPPKVITDQATAELEVRGYTVYRTPGWNSGPGGTGGTHYTYTNAMVFNNVVVMSEFGGGYALQDEQARAVFEEAFPYHQIVQADSSSIIYAAGAIHCIVMHVPGYRTLMQVTPAGGLQSSGQQGGPFTPDTMVYTISNSGESAIDYQVTHNAPWISIANSSGTIAPQSSVEVAVAINSEAYGLDVGVYEDTVEFTNLTDHDGDTSRAVRLTVGTPQAVHLFSMNRPPGWSMTGQWAHGLPTGQGGEQYGNPDPAGGATGFNVCGVNLDGDYSVTPGGPYFLTTDAIDCSGLAEVSLRFQRWLNSDYQPYVSATVEASGDGANWTMVWQNGGSEITDDAWTEQVFDISAIADQASTLYIRWGYAVGSGAYAYSGWNVDDVEIWGLQLSAAVGDLNDDGSVNAADLALLLGAWGPCSPPADCPADLNDDGSVDAADLALLLGGWSA